MNYYLAQDTVSERTLIAWRLELLDKIAHYTLALSEPRSLERREIKAMELSLAARRDQLFRINRMLDIVDCSSGRNGELGKFCKK